VEFSRYQEKALEFFCRYCDGLQRRCEGVLPVPVRLARKFIRESQPTRDRHKGDFKRGYYLDNKLCRFGFIGMCKFLDQGEGQDGASLHREREVSVTNAKHMR
jgi:hypothetical protein